MNTKLGRVRSSWAAYGVSLAAVAVAMGLPLLLEPLLNESIPFITLFAAVAFVAWYAGRGPALLALAAGAAGVAFFIIEPRYSFVIAQFEYQAGLALYGVVGIATIAMFESLRKAQQRAEAKQWQLEQEVTARRAAEQSLAAREELLRITFASIGDAVITTDISGNVTYLNPVAQELTGWTQDEAHAKPLTTVFRIINGDSRHPVVSPIQEVLRERRVAGLANHTLLISKDGTERPIDDSAAPIQDEQAKVVGCVLVFRDVTQQRQAQKMVRERERYFREIIDVLPAAIYTTDAEGRLTHFNPATVEVSGRTPELTTDRWCVTWKLFRADGTPLPHDKCPMAVALKEGRNLHGEQIIAERPDGSRRWIEVYPTILRDAEGRVTGGINMLIDITTRKQAEQELRQRTAQFETLLNEAPLGVYVIDEEFRIRHVNPSTFKVFGDIPDLIGRDFDEVMHILWPKVTADEIVQRFRHTHETGEPYFTPELIEQRLDRGVTEIYEWQIHRIPLPEGRHGVVCYFREISAQVQAHIAIAESDRRKDEFLATLAHELRNPLAPISNSLELMKRARGDTGVIEQARCTMERQLGQMVRLIDDLLDVSRITLNKLELKKERVELASVVRHAVETCRSNYERAGHELNVTLSPEPLYLLADPARLAQVFANLLTNSGKYTETGGRIWLTAERQGNELVVKIKDTGIGIPPGMVPKVFDLFMQGDDHSLERSDGGLGIGLSLVKRLVEMHGGTVRAHSEGVGRGSEFTLHLPILIEKRKGPPRPAPAAETVPVTGRRILVVDDNRDSADSLAILLSVTGNDTLTAHDGVEAVEKASSFRPEVILLDIGLPKMNGYNACRAIREQPWGKDIMMVALTGWGQEEDHRKSKEAGFDGHLVKPVDHAHLMKLLSGELAAKV